MKISFALLVLLAGAGTAHAQATGKGFTIERYEPTPAGEWSIWVDHPRYTPGKFSIAGGLTLDYSHDPLVFGTRDASGFQKTQAVIEHQMAMHLDVAASFIERINVSLSLPIVLFERGAAVSGVSPLSGGAVGDPRIGAMVRLWGRPLRDAFSVSLGAALWIPISANGNHAGDSTVRFMPKIALGGFTHHVMWSWTGAFQYRADASLPTSSPSAGSSVGSELQLGAAIAYADLQRRFAVGPEAIVATVLTSGAGNIFSASYTSVELLLAGHYNVVKQIELGLALGLGAAREPGTPDFRTILRVAYAPMREPATRISDRDGDGIADRDDACPDEPGLRSADRAQNGCPLRDRDRDGVPDADDLCPDVPRGDHPDPARPGCPLKDSDGDGIFDGADQCPEVPAGAHPDKNKPGCPDTDRDGDGVFDSIDQCPDQPAGLHPDPDKPGCALPDRDADQIPDAIDACPDQPGAPDPDPKKNGCPGLVLVKNGKLVIMQPVFFATNKDVILERSFPVLQAVANALTAEPEIKRMSVEGHTDSQGKPEKNLDLSERRAASVRKWLIEHGVQEERLESHGFGQTQPVSSNANAKGRAANRRVEFRIVERPPSD